MQWRKIAAVAGSLTLILGMPAHAQQSAAPGAQGTHSTAWEEDPYRNIPVVAAVVSATEANFTPVKSLRNLEKQYPDLRSIFEEDAFKDFFNPFREDSDAVLSIARIAEDTVILRFESMNFCGSMGCTTFIYSKTADGYSLTAGPGAMSLPIYYTNSGTNGTTLYMRDDDGAYGQYQLSQDGKFDEVARGMTPTPASHPEQQSPAPGRKP